jgi:uncharacterized cupredoxin-like copper-binding protein
MQHKKRSLILGVAAGLFAATSPARAHSDTPHPKKAGPVKKEQKDWGIAGEARAAKRSIKVRMLDSMRFEPSRIDVRQGETIRFSVSNTGKVLHEFVIGTQQENAAHAALMLKFPNMEHDEPYMAHVPPGQSGQIVWTFNRPGEFEFACLMAGHYQGGMVGRLVVAAA